MTGSEFGFFILGAIIGVAGAIALYGFEEVDE